MINCIKKLGKEDFSWCGNFIDEENINFITLERALWIKLTLNNGNNKCEICPTCLSEIVNVIRQ